MNDNVIWKNFKVTIVDSNIPSQIISIPSDLTGLETKKFLIQKHRMEFCEDSFLAIKTYLDDSIHRCLIVKENRNFFSNFHKIHSNIIELYIIPKNITLRIHLLDGRISEVEYPTLNTPNDIISSLNFNSSLYGLYKSPSNLNLFIPNYKTPVEFDAFNREYWLLKQFFLDAKIVNQTNNEIYYNYISARNIFFNDDFQYKFYQWEKLLSISLTIEFGSIDQAELFLNENSQQTESSKSYFPSWFLSKFSAKWKKTRIINEIMNYQSQDSISLKKLFVDICLENKFFGFMKFDVRAYGFSRNDFDKECIDYLGNYTLCFSDEYLHFLNIGTEKESFKINLHLISRFCVHQQGILFKTFRKNKLYDKYDGICVGKQNIFLLFYYFQSLVLSLKKIKLDRPQTQEKSFVTNMPAVNFNAKSSPTNVDEITGPDPNDNSNINSNRNSNLNMNSKIELNRSLSDELSLSIPKPIKSQSTLQQIPIPQMLSQPFSQKLPPIPKPAQIQPFSQLTTGFPKPIQIPLQELQVEKELRSKIMRLEEELIETKKRYEDEIKELKNDRFRQNQKKLIEILDEDTINELDKIEKIGSGSSGKVYKVSKKEFYALKVMKFDVDFNEIKRFASEYEIMSMLDHPNILKTHGIYLSGENQPPSILLEYCPSNLEQYIKSKKYSNSMIVFGIYQIVEGMNYVHSRKIIHRDLKPSNILIDSDGILKIGDFGISKLMNIEDQSMTKGVGTQRFMAPEIIDESDKYNEKVDVYSFGVLVYFMLTGGDIPKIKLSDKLKGKKADIPSYFTPFTKNLISDCWNYNSKDRPSFNNILKLMEDNDYSFVDLESKEINEVKALIRNHKCRIPLYQ